MEKVCAEDLLPYILFKSWTQTRENARKQIYFLHFNRKRHLDLDVFPFARWNRLKIHRNVLLLLVNDQSINWVPEMLCYQEIYFLLSELHLLTLACPSYLHFLNKSEYSEPNLSLPPSPEKSLHSFNKQQIALKCCYSIRSTAGMVPVASAELTCCLLLLWWGGWRCKALVGKQRGCGFSQ